MLSKHVTTTWKYTPVYAECKNSHFVCIIPSEHGTSDGRNLQLLAKRLANIYNTKDEIKNINLDANISQEGPAKEIDIANLNFDEAQEIVKKLKNALMKGQKNNTALSESHGKLHISSKQNKNLGMSWLKALWNATWIQSRANTVLEDAIEAVENYEKQKLLTHQTFGLTSHVIATPPPFNPELPRKRG